jgi:tetratricopeptide (TPR) repeat protein
MSYIAWFKNFALYIAPCLPEARMSLRAGRVTNDKGVQNFRNNRLVLLLAPILLSIPYAIYCEQSAADDYIEQGNAYAERGDLVQAEAMYKKALATAQAMQRKRDMAAAYGNLGIVYKDRGDLVEAEVMYKQALAIDESLGLKEETADLYANLGNMYEVQGKLAQAEAMHQKELAINESLGRREGVASAYIGLADYANAAVRGRRLWVATGPSSSRNGLIPVPGFIR